MTAKRRIGPFEVNPIGFGCMALSHAYGVPPALGEASRLLNRALDFGCDFLDTAALYGFGANERLIGEAIGHRRSEYVLASKCGMTGVEGRRVIDGRPETLRRTVDESLHRLKTDVIDLYYLHRWDKKVPIEESVGALADLAAVGKIRAIGLSEVSADTLERAFAVHPIAAVQSEYSPWSRNVEIGVLAATRALGAALVAFSPLARGLLAGRILSRDDLSEGDIRRGMPRFEAGNLARNLALYARFGDLAAEVGCRPAQLSIAWVLAKGEHVVAIPGTTSPEHLSENIGSSAVRLTPEIIARVDALFVTGAISGSRYPLSTHAEIDTEEFAENGVALHRPRGTIAFA